MPYSFPRVYLAGPDVFYPDVKERAQWLKDRCQEFGFEGVFPLDNEVLLAEPLNDWRNGQKIYESNLSLIESCRAVLANLTPFRGPSADVGTVLEVGYGLAKGLLIVGYSDKLTPYKERVTPDGLMIEDFSAFDNLMVAGACLAIQPTPDRALACLKNLLDLGVV